MPGGTFQVDFSHVKELEAIPAGTYRLECVDADLRVSEGEKTGGAQMLFMHWKVADGPHENSRIFDNLIFHDSTMWRVKQAFNAMFGKGQTAFNMHTSEFAGVQVRARVIQDVYAKEDGGDESVRNRIQKYEELAGGGRGDPETSSGVDDLFK
jgi:hypothetical protein